MWLLLHSLLLIVVYLQLFDKLKLFGMYWMRFPEWNDTVGIFFLARLDIQLEIFGRWLTVMANVIM